VEPNFSSYRRRLSKFDRLDFLDSNCCTGTSFGHTKKEGTHIYSLKIYLLAHPRSNQRKDNKKTGFAFIFQNLLQPYKREKEVVDPSTKESGAQYRDVSCAVVQRAFVLLMNSNLNIW